MLPHEKPCRKEGHTCSKEERSDTQFPRIAALHFLCMQAFRRHSWKKCTAVVT